MLVVCGNAVRPVWTEIDEHTTLADLLEVVSSGREYFRRLSRAPSWPLDGYYF